MCKCGCRYENESCFMLTLGLFKEKKRKREGEERGSGGKRDKES